jgi:hypothetical protein
MQTWWDLNSPYRYRNDNLRRMGFKSFRANLRSPLWASIRARVLEIAPKCQCCFKRPARQVHHRAYDPATLKGESIGCLDALCARCHTLAERPSERQQPYKRLMNANRRIAKKRKRRPVAQVLSAPRLIKPEDADVQ